MTYEEMQEQGAEKAMRKDWEREQILRERESIRNEGFDPDVIIGYNQSPLADYPWWYSGSRSDL